MKTKDLLTLALLGGGAYLVYRGMRAQQLLGEATQTGLVPVTPPERAVEEPPTQADKEGYVPYVPPKKPPQGEPIKPYEEPPYPRPPSGLSVQGMLRQFFSYLSLYSMYGEQEYKYRYEEIMPQLLAIAGDKRKKDVVDDGIIDVLVDRYYVARSQLIEPITNRYYQGFVIWDKKTKKRYAVSVSKILPTIAPFFGPKGAFGDITSLQMADQMMNPNVSVGELVYQAISLAKRQKMPIEAFALPTWSAAHEMFGKFGTYSGVKLPIDWLRFWITRGYKPRYIKAKQLPASQYHPKYWYVIEPNHKVSGSLQKKLLNMIDRIGPSYVMNSARDPKYKTLIEFRTLLNA